MSAGRASFIKVRPSGPATSSFLTTHWDYNGDGMTNDPLTHVGIVERQEADGTVVFISRVAGAIERTA